MRGVAVLLRLNIAQRIVLLIFLGVGGVLAVVTFSDYRNVRRMLIDELQAKAQNLALATARRMEVMKIAVENVIEELGVIIENDSFDTAQLSALLRATVARHGEIYGSAIVLEEFVKEGGEGVIPYAYRQGNEIVQKNLNSETYRYETYDWYSLPREMKVSIWTEPYYDEGGGDSLMVTYSVPIFDPAGKRFRGVVTGDVALGWLTDMLMALDLGKGGYAVVISRNGNFIAHPREEFIMRESVFSLAEERGEDEFRRIGQSMVRGESGFIPFRSLLTGEPSWVAYTPVPETGWSLAVVFYQKELMAKVLSLSQMKVIVGCLGLLGLVIVAVWIARSITRPIRDLDAATRILAGGNLNAALPAIRGNDEIARLTRSFSRMQGDLKKYIEEIQTAAAARARMESDLRIAREIQMGLVPSRFDFDPPRPEVELYALLDPAREVGGDFYDFFWLDRHRLFFAVGDVSGKGIPAALFMSLSKAFLEAFVKQGLGPAEALARLNDELSAGNEACMFITVFCGLLDVRTGECAAANGGHNPPFILRSSGSAEVLPKGEGGVLGSDRGAVFERSGLKLEPGDLLLAYTDGVVEAQDPEEAFYGDERALERLRSLGGKSAEEVVKGLREDLRRFSGSAPQSDDITILAIAFRGGLSRS